MPQLHIPRRQHRAPTRRQLRRTPRGPAVADQAVRSTAAAHRVGCCPTDRVGDHAASPTKHAQARGPQGGADERQVNLDQQFGRLHDHWHPKTVATGNDYEVKLVKVQGEFVWQQHQDTDELLLVIDGQLRIQLQNHGDVALGPGELLVVPRGCATTQPPTRRPACCSWSCGTRSTPAMPTGWAPSAAAHLTGRAPTEQPG
jgi:mannose-6-phosphate isomerase-like protein (cupin superfamily)